MMFVACRHAHPIAQEGEHKCCDIEEIHMIKDFNMRISFSPQLSFIIRKSFQKDSGTKCWNLVGLSRAFRPPKPDLISVPIIRLKFPMFKSHFYERNGGPLSSFDCAKSRIMGKFGPGVHWILLLAPIKIFACVGKATGPTYFSRKATSKRITQHLNASRKLIMHRALRELQITTPI